MGPALPENKRTLTWKADMEKRPLHPPAATPDNADAKPEPAVEAPRVETAPEAPRAGARSIAAWARPEAYAPAI